VKLAELLTPQQLRLRENQLFLAVTIAVGVLAGLSAVLFSLAIDLVSHLFFGVSPTDLRTFLVPTLVSLGTGFLLSRFFPDVRGSGVPQTTAAYVLKNGFIPWRVPIGKFLTGVLCIGSGHSIGREGPSVQIGAGIASGVGRWLRLPRERLKELIPVGAAAALSAAFNTPVAAVIFALEEIIGDMNATLLGSTVVASVSAVIVERSILGNEPLFRVPAYHLVHPAELVAYAVLGIGGGLVSVLFSKGLLKLRAFFLKLPERTRVFQPAIGGVAIGLILIFIPQVRGVGYEYVDQALNGGLVLRWLLLLAAFKLIATTISYASGNAGGIFAPSLFIGAMAGGAIGTVVHRLAPLTTGEPAAYALVGMGTLSPMTSVFMIFEITQDYQILVPLMVANVLSFAISRKLQPTNVYHALLLQDHVHLPPAVRPDLPRGPIAAELLTDGFVVAQEGTTIGAALAEAERSAGTVILVMGDEGLVGTVSTAQLGSAVQRGMADDTLGAVTPRNDVHVHEDHPLDVVLERLSRSGGVLPVVRREHTTDVQGVITRRSILRRLRLEELSQEADRGGPAT
jgi:CIC family chloride channel protein